MPQNPLIGEIVPGAGQIVLSRAKSSFRTTGDSSPSVDEARLDVRQQSSVAGGFVGAVPP
jgi:hypothetical protein